MSSGYTWVRVHNSMVTCKSVFKNVNEKCTGSNFNPKFKNKTPSSWLYSENDQSKTDICEK